MARRIKAEGRFNGGGGHTVFAFYEEREGEWQLAGLDFFEGENRLMKHLQITADEFARLRTSNNAVTLADTVSHPLFSPRNDGGTTITSQVLAKRTDTHARFDIDLSTLMNLMNSSDADVTGEQIKLLFDPMAFWAQAPLLLTGG